MVAVDILKVPISSKGNNYLLVLQDYFTKWPEAIPLKDQTAETIVRTLVKIFSVYGMPRYLHSDQGANFESAILKKTCEVFGIKKSHTSPYHPQGDGMVERLNKSLLQMLQMYNSVWRLGKMATIVIVCLPKFMSCIYKILTISVDVRKRAKEFEFF